MAVEHKTHPVVGVQFHPESAATEYGYAILDRFLHGERARIDGLSPLADGGREVPEDALPPWAAPARVTDDSFVPPPVELVR